MVDLEQLNAVWPEDCDLSELDAEAVEALAGAIVEDGMGFLNALCSCGYRCQPCPDEDTCIDALMQHAYEAGTLAGRANP